MTATITDDQIATLTDAVEVLNDLGHTYAAGVVQRRIDESLPQPPKVGDVVAVYRTDGTNSFRDITVIAEPENRSDYYLLVKGESFGKGRVWFALATWDQEKRRLVSNSGRTDGYSSQIESMYAHTDSRKGLGLLRDTLTKALGK